MDSRKLSTIRLDAKKFSYGRLASVICLYLQGKHLADYRPNVVTNIRVVVNNISLVKFTGKKLEYLKRHSYSGYPGGIKTIDVKSEHISNPASHLRESVRKMLPKNKLTQKLLRNLIVVN